MADQFQDVRDALNTKIAEKGFDSDKNVLDELNKLHHNIFDDPRKIVSTFELYDLDLEIKKFKRSLEAWREVILPINSLLSWEKNWYPGALIAGTTILFVILWLLEPSVLTTFSLLSLTLTLSDYLVPILIKSIYKADSWTSKKEIEFENVCRSLVIYKTTMHISLISYYQMRSERPKLFYLCTILSLLFIAYIGNVFNNLFLTYLFVISLILLPGLLQHGLLKRYGSTITSLYTGFSESFRKRLANVKKEE